MQRYKQQQQVYKNRMKIKKVKKIILETLSLQKQLVDNKPTTLPQQQKLKNYKSEQFKRKSFAQLISDQRKRKQLIILTNSPKSENQGINIKVIRQRIQKFLNQQNETKINKSNHKDFLFFNNEIVKDQNKSCLISQNSNGYKLKQRHLRKEPHSLQMLKRKLNMNQSKLRQSFNNSLMRRSLKIGDSKGHRKGAYPYHMFFNCDLSSSLNKQQKQQNIKKKELQQYNTPESNDKTSFFIKRRKKQSKYLKRKDFGRIMNEGKDQSQVIIVNKKTVEQQNNTAKMKFKQKMIPKNKIQRQLFEPWSKHHDQFFFEQDFSLNQHN